MGKPSAAMRCISPLIMNFSPDCIVTRSVRRLYIFSHSFTCEFQIWDLTKIHWVTIEILIFLPYISGYFTAAQQMLVQSQFLHSEVTQRHHLHNLGLLHLTMGWDLGYVIGAKLSGNISWTGDLGSIWSENCGSTSGPGNKHSLTKWVRLPGGSRPSPVPPVQFKHKPQPNNPEPLPRVVKVFVVLVYYQLLSRRITTWFIFGILNIVLFVDFVASPVGWCCKICNSRRQAGPFKSKLACLINSDQEQSRFWQLLFPIY